MHLTGGPGSSHLCGGTAREPLQGALDPVGLPRGDAAACGVRRRASLGLPAVRPACVRGRACGASALRQRVNCPWKAGAVWTQ